MSSLGRSIVFIALALSSIAGCSRDSSSEPEAQPATVEPVAQVDWGTSPGNFGRVTSDESAPEGPASLVADSFGRVYVLDQLNSRIQIIEGGKVSGSVALPSTLFEDLDFFDDGFVLLSRLERAALVFIGPGGEARGEVSLLGDNLDEASFVTSIASREDGVWVEVNDEYMVRVADAAGKPDAERPVVPGRLTLAGDAVMRTEVEDFTKMNVYRQVLDGPVEQLASVATEGEIGGRTLLESNSSGKILLALLIDHYEGDGTEITEREHVLKILGADGAEVRSEPLPPPGGPEDIFRPVRMGQDGNVYALRCTDDGTEIVRYLP